MVKSKSSPGQARVLPGKQVFSRASKPGLGFSSRASKRLRTSTRRSSWTYTDPRRRSRRRRACLPWRSPGYPLRTECQRKTKTKNPRARSLRGAAERGSPGCRAACVALSRDPLRTSELENWEIEAKEGLPSADRNNKATLLLTGPFRTAKSSAKDLIPQPLKLQYASRRRALRARRGVRLLRCEAGAYSHAPEACGRYRRVPARILT